MDKKKVNFTEVERALLIDLVGKYSAVVENKKSDAVSVNRKKAAWRKIEQEFNSRHGIIPRSEKQLRKCWENLKEKFRKAKGADTRETFATGGGSPKPSQLTDELIRVGQIASHLSTRLGNTFDNDRARYGVRAPAVRAVPPTNAGVAPTCDDADNTETAAGLLSQMYSSRSEEIEDNTSAHHEAVERDLPDESLPGEAIAQLDSEPQLVQGLSPSCVLYTSEATTSTSTPSTALQGGSRPAGLLREETTTPRRQATQLNKPSDELEARLRAVAAEDGRKQQEHLFKMQLLRAERRHKAALYKQKLENAKMKSTLLQLKIQKLQKSTE